MQEHLTGALNPADGKIQSPVLVAGVLYLNSKLFFLHRTKPVPIVTVCLDNFETSGSLQRLPMHTLKHIPLGSFRGNYPPKIAKHDLHMDVPFLKTLQGHRLRILYLLLDTQLPRFQTIALSQRSSSTQKPPSCFFFPVAMFVSFL